MPLLARVEKDFHFLFKPADSGGRFAFQQRVLTQGIGFNWRARPDLTQRQFQFNDMWRSSSLVVEQRL
jgi:hypothetical protein